MFSHIQVGARDLQVMVAFYDSVLGLLGWVRLLDDDDDGPPGAGWHRLGLSGHSFMCSNPTTGCRQRWVTACRSVLLPLRRSR